MEKKSKGSAVAKSIVLVLLGAVVILGLYLMLTRNKRSVQTEESYELTAVDEITTTNLDKNYPANPRKVVELYAHTMQVLYRETYNDTQEDAMISVLRGIMDDELLANNNRFEQSVKDEVTERRAGDYSISNFVVQTKEPEEVTVDGRRMCNVDCLFSLRQSTKGTTANYYQFILRKDSETGQWKILGWTLKEDD